MATSESAFEVPTSIAGAIVLLVIAAIGYVFVYGGEAITPVLVVVGAISFGLGLFTLYLFYRFVLAVEKIADKY